MKTMKKTAKHEVIGGSLVQSCLALAVAVGLAPLVRGDVHRLTYTGEDSGDWTAENVWKDGSGNSVRWSDGAIAVIDDKSVAIPSDVNAYGIEYTKVTVARYLTGAGRLTLGAGGLVVKESGNDQINIRNTGGVHLAANQTWSRPDNKSFCLDEMHPLTAASGVTWTIDGGTLLRVNSQGSLGSDVTVVFRGNAQLSPSEGNPGLGTPKLVFEGAGVTSTFGAQWCSSVFGGTYASSLTLRSGASLAFNASKICRFEVPELAVDGDAADSRFTGGLVRLASGETVFDVTGGHALTLGAILTNATATVVKRGVGTLTLLHPEEPIDFTVSDGTLKFAFTGYRHYRFKIDKAYGLEAKGAQISEFKLLNGETAIAGGKASYADGTKVTWDPGKDCSPGEDPTMAVDGNLETKWLDWRAGTSRIASEGDKVWVQLSYDTPVFATSYAWATADDAAPSTGKGCNDPAAWRLLASDDGENWVELDKRENMGPYETRNAWVVGTFPVTYPAGRGANAKLGRIVVEEGGTLDLRDFTASSAVSGIIENRGGTILTDAGARTGNAVMVLGGTLSRGPATFGGKFFRVTVTGNGGAEKISIAEFSLYAADGTRVNQGTFTKVDSPDSLAANQVALATSGSVSNWENIDKVFDGDAGTKLHVTGLTPSAESSVAFTFRLPESAARVAGYTFTAAADSEDGDSGGGAFYRRNPTAWKIEGSFDGETWQVLDEQTDVSAPKTNKTEYNNGVPYAVMAWGDPAEGEERPFSEDAVVSVAPDATLDLRSEKMVLGHLSVDCTTGAGTITRFTPAESGSIDVRHSDVEKLRAGFALPLTVETVNRAARLKKWTVLVDGVADERLRVVYRKEDGLRIETRGGFLLLFR